MAQNIKLLYKNDFGIAFSWQYDIDNKRPLKVQLIFRDTGFYLTQEQLIHFSLQASKATSCEACDSCLEEHSGRNVLLKTPASEIDMAVSKTELIDIKDLVEGTLFQLRLENYLNALCKN